MKNTLKINNLFKYKFNKKLWILYKYYNKLYKHIILKIYRIKFNNFLTKFHNYNSLIKKFAASFIIFLWITLNNKINFYNM
jgi:hypothetical protein